MAEQKRRVIMPGDLAGSYESPEAIRDREIKDLMESKYSHKPITGKILKMEDIGKSGAEIMGLFAVFNYGISKLTVKVAAEDFVINIPDTLVPRYAGSKETQTPLQFCRRYINNHMGGTYKFVVKDIIQDEDGEVIAIASRKTAMERDVQDYFFSRHADNRIEVGTIVGARITSVFERTLLVEVCGIETRISRSDVAYDYLPDLRRLFNVGEVIEVYVKELERKDGQVTKLVASKKDAEDDPRDRNIKLFKVGDICSGEVVHTLDTGCIVSLNDGMFSCLTPFALDFTRPAIGCQVFVKINKIDKEKKLIYGFIQSKATLRDLRKNNSEM